MSPRFSLSEMFLRTQTDERLCALVSDGHSRAFAVLVERHRVTLLRAAGRVGGPQRAEDVVQEALLRAWRALAAGTRVEHVPAWLHQIVRNTALNHLASARGLEEPLPDELADPQQLADAIAARQMAHDLLARIAELPNRQRTALVETELAGRSREAIAADLGLSEGAVRQLVHRARSSVRVAMTAITPFPLAAWIARRGVAPGAVDRLAGLPHGGAARSPLLEALGGGSAAGTGVLLKGGAAIIAAGALGGGLAWRELSHTHAHRRVHHAAAAPGHTAAAAGSASTPGAAQLLAAGVVPAAARSQPAPGGSTRRSVLTLGTNRANATALAGGTGTGGGLAASSTPTGTRSPSGPLMPSGGSRSGDSGGSSGSTDTSGSKGSTDTGGSSGSSDTGGSGGTTGSTDASSSGTTTSSGSGSASGSGDTTTGGGADATSSRDGSGTSSGTSTTTTPTTTTLGNSGD